MNNELSYIFNVLCEDCPTPKLKNNFQNGDTLSITLNNVYVYKSLEPIKYLIIENLGESPQI